MNRYSAYRVLLWIHDECRRPNWWRQQFLRLLMMLPWHHDDLIAWLRARPWLMPRQPGLPTKPHKIEIRFRLTAQPQSQPQPQLCAHMQCPECHGTGVGALGPCVHYLYCSCPRCQPQFTNTCLELGRQIEAASVANYLAMNMQATEMLRLHGLHTP